MSGAAPPPPSQPPAAVTAAQAVAQLWREPSLGGLPEQALSFLELTGAEPALPSSFMVGTAAQASIAAAALAACEVGHLRGQPRQRVSVDMRHAAAECTSWFSVDGRTPELWDPFSGLYRCADGWVRVHANFAHHRAGALRLFGLDPLTATRAAAEAALAGCSASAFEQAASDAGLVVTALRDFAQWDSHPQGQAVAAQPLLRVERIGGQGGAASARAWPALAAGVADAQPLSGLRVLDLTRILAGPVGCRMLAGLGADVLMVNGPHLPNIDAIADLSRGKRSAQLDLRQPAGAAAMRELLAQAHVIVQGYRPGGLATLGFGPEDAARMSPGIIYASLSAYGPSGPWSSRRGFDSLVQTAMGFNVAEAQGMGSDTPRALPVQMLDHGAGYLIVLGVCAALMRQQAEGGSWHVQVSLARTGQWLRSLGRQDGAHAPRPDPQAYQYEEQGGYGMVRGVAPAARLSRTPMRHNQPAMPPGSHPAQWW